VRSGFPVTGEVTELLETIRAVHAGKKALSTEASYQLAEHATDDALTPAEIRVLRLIAEGNANKEIAAQLSVSEETVKGQVRNILSKLGANDRTHAAMDRRETRNHRDLDTSKEWLWSDPFRVLGRIGIS
jgi:DNA-binding NarL/FixJ family response regulator